MEELVVTLIIGALCCFCGLKLQRVVVALAWVTIGYKVASFVFTNMIPIDNPNLLLVLCVSVGLILGALSVWFLKANTFIFLFIVGFMIGMHYLEPNVLGYIISAVIGLVLGSLAVKLVDPMIIIGTSIYGALLLSGGLSDYFPEVEQYELFLFIGLAAFGMLSQFGTLLSSKS